MTCFSVNSALWEDYILMFVSHPHFYTIHQQQWCKHHQDLQSSWENNALEQCADLSISVCSAPTRHESWDTSSSYRTGIFTLISVEIRGSFGFPNQKWFLQVIYHGDSWQGQHNHSSLLGLHSTAQPNNHQHPKLPWSSTGGTNLFFTLHTIRSGGFILQINFEFLSSRILTRVPNKLLTFN